MPQVTIWAEGLKQSLLDLFVYLNFQLAIFYHEHVFTKDPGTNRATPWHHDQSYYPVDGWKVT